MNARAPRIRLRSSLIMTGLSSTLRNLSERDFVSGAVDTSAVIMTLPVSG
jgi:hypothetical protein